MSSLSPAVVRDLSLVLALVLVVGVVAHAL